MQGYDNGVNDVTEVVLDCHRAIHFVYINYEASWPNFHIITPTTPKWLSGDLAIGVYHSSWCLQHHFCSSVMVSMKLFSFKNNTKNHSALVQFKSWWRWCMCLALWPGAIAGGLAFNPRLCKRIGMVWHDTQVPLTSLSFVWSWLASLIQFHRAGFTMRQSSLRLVHLKRPLLGRSLTFQASWYLYCNLLMTLCDTQNSFVTSDCVLPVYSLAIAK